MIDLTVYQQILLYSFLVAAVLGFVSNKTNFCTMGAVADLVLVGHAGRMRAWIMASALSAIAVTVLNSLGMIDIALTADAMTAKPPYTAPKFNIAGHILGGLLFGIGMTLGSGCGNKTLVRIGSGNTKSLVVFFAMGIGAYFMIYPNFLGYNELVYSVLPTIDFRQFGLSGQGLDTIFAAVSGSDLYWSRLFITLLIALPAVLWVCRSQQYTRNPDNILGSLAAAAAVVSIFWLTAGPMGQLLLEEAQFMDDAPYDAGVQSMTFVKQTGQFLWWAQSGFSARFVSIAMVAALGVAGGSFLYSMVTCHFGFEWFSDPKDLVLHAVGGFIMGTGGVLALGCTFGQAISGVATLALGSFVTFGFIVLGAAISLHMRNCLMMYRGEVTFWQSLLAALLSLRLLPKAFNKLLPRKLRKCAAEKS